MKNDFSEERVYFVSQYDGRVHCLYDCEYQLIDEKNAYIGKNTLEGFRVDDEVELWNVIEVSEFYK